MRALTKRVIRYMYANMKEVEPMPFTIRYNARTVHLEGIAERTTSPATDNSATTGVVSYYAQSACAALTRSGSRMGAYGDHIDSIALALDTFRDVAKWKGLKMCANCERAAVTALERAYNAGQRNARDAAADLDRATNSDSAEWHADAERRFERLHDTYVELAAAVGRCLIFGCDAKCDDYRSYCPEHDTTDDIEDAATASAIEAEMAARHEADRAALMLACTEHAALVDRIMAGEFGGAKTYADAEALAVAIEREPEAFVSRGPDPEAAYNARRALYRTAADLHEEHGGEANRDAAAAAWHAFVAAARLAGKCIDFTCYADAEPDADHCQRHHKRVTARLDHTEPGKAIALIEGGHGREAAPQAWLAHEGGSWLLVDDYDGDTLNVKGPDAERAVHAWAALLGLRLDALAVEVEYAGGPVSPPVREPERPVADALEWVWMSNDGGTNVFEANGHAHVYRVTEHADAAGASLVGTLRNTEVVTYRRGYMDGPDARKAAQHYEARYGSAYVPVK